MDFHCIEAWLGLPALLSLYAVITLTTHVLIEKGMTCGRSTAWYCKTRLTFADAMVWVLRPLWDHLHFSMSQQEADMIKIPLIDTLCYAA